MDWDNGTGKHFFFFENLVYRRNNSKCWWMWWYVQGSRWHFLSFFFFNFTFEVYRLVKVTTPKRFFLFDLEFLCLFLFIEFLPLFHCYLRNPDLRLRCKVICWGVRSFCYEILCSFVFFLLTPVNTVCTTPRRLLLIFNHEIGNLHRRIITDGEGCSLSASYFRCRIPRISQNAIVGRSILVDLCVRRWPYQRFSAQVCVTGVPSVPLTATLLQTWQISLEPRLLEAKMQRKITFLSTRTQKQPLGAVA